MSEGRTLLQDRVREVLEAAGKLDSVDAEIAIALARALDTDAPSPAKNAEALRAVMTSLTGAGPADPLAEIEEELAGDAATGMV